jgi:hypothetical protein
MLRRARGPAMSAASPASPTPGAVSKPTELTL